MPLLSLHGLTLFYDFLTEFDDKKETILLLPGFLSNAAFNAAQYSDPRLRQHYNLLCVECRYFSSRATSTKLCLELDISVQAAEIALVLEELNLPAVHVFAPQSQACTISKRFAYLFPEKVLSMVLAGLTNLYESEDSINVYQAILEAWVGEDVSNWNEATVEILEVMFEGQAQHQAAMWAHNVASRIRQEPEAFYLNTLSAIHRKEIPKTALAQIQCPILLVQGTPDGKAECAEWYSRQLAKSKSEILPVYGAPHAVSITNANIVNRSALKFLSKHRFDPARALKPVKTDWEAALKRLPAMVNFPIDIRGRNPRDPVSYSVVKPEEIEERQIQVELLKRRDRSFLEKYGQEEQFDLNTKIENRFSDRHQLHGP